MFTGIKYIVKADQEKKCNTVSFHLKYNSGTDIVLNKDGMWMPLSNFIAFRRTKAIKLFHDGIGTISIFF